MRGCAALPSVFLGITAALVFLRHVRLSITEDKTMPVSIITNKLAKSQPTKPRYADALAGAKALNMDSHPDEVNEVLVQIASGQFKPVRLESLIQAVQKKTKIPKPTLRQQLKAVKLELGLEPNDLALEVTRAVRKKHFNNGLHLLRTIDGTYMRFVDTHWTVTDKGELRKLVFEEAKKVHHLFGGKSFSSLVSQAWSCLDDSLGTDEDVMNPHDDLPPKINVKNGELCINEDGTATLTPHKPESKLSYCLPIKYDLEAKCPRYDQALLEIFVNSSDPQDMVRHWNEFVGYAIQSSRNIPSYWILIGHGANGKTQLLRTLEHLMGPEAVLFDSIARFMQDRFNTAYLNGKLLFADEDITEGVVLDDGLLKKISEHKLLSARRAYGRRKQNFICRALPVMAGNSFPITRDISYGMWRRAMVIPFDRVFSPEEQDTALFPEIWKDELPGVLNRALDGLKRLFERGEQFDPPKDCLAAKQEFFIHANPLAGFLAEKCEEDPDGRIWLDHLRAEIKAWMKEQGLKNPQVADNTLRRKLIGLGHKVKQVNGYGRLYGFVLKAP